MLITVVGLFLLQLADVCYAAPRLPIKRLNKRQNTIPSELPCLSVIAQAQQGVVIFEASEVYDCISKVPFNADVASRFIDYYNETLQYQSTLAFLERPPAGYQQPPVDLQQELEDIKADVSSGAFKNQYAFEARMQLFVSTIHDSHVILDSGILSAFRFASPWSLVSVSPDGKEEPRIYLRDDILAATVDNFTPSPVIKINNEDVMEYLTSLVGPNSDGYVEPHADWNSLMESPTKEAAGPFSMFQRLTLYPGANLTFTFENGTLLETIWLALYVEDSNTGPLTTPGDFYNYFVLGLIPADFDPDAPTVWWPAEYNVTWNEDTSENLTGPAFDCLSNGEEVVNWCSVTNGSIGAYPNDPVVVQSNFSTLGSSVVSAYLIDEISTGVLSIPSFYQEGQGVEDFFNAVNEFVGNATEKKTERLIIDLQQNAGGMVFLALTTFQQFFPTVEPYAESRIRSHQAANILGTAYSTWWDSFEMSANFSEIFAASEWMATERINAETGLNFASWSEYFGPVLDHDDAFSNKQLYNLSDADSSEATFGATYDAWLNSNFTTAPGNWSPDEIVILTDGLCSSACSLFVELMTSLAGVRTVTVGGRPANGPMQTASGNRGAAAYTAYDLDEDYNWVQSIDQEWALGSLRSRNDTGIFTRFASVNLRDQMRPDDLIPLQFRYEASDCRLYYTPNNVYNMTQLWKDVKTAVWDDTSLCVSNSTGFSLRTKEGRKDPPQPIAESPTQNLIPQNPDEDALDISSDVIIGLMDATPPRSSAIVPRRCANGRCQATFTCQFVNVLCPSGNTVITDARCFADCDTTSGGAGCDPVRFVQSPMQQVDDVVVQGISLPNRVRPPITGQMGGRPQTGTVPVKKELYRAAELGLQNSPACFPAV